MSKRRDKRILCALVLFALFAVQMLMHMNCDNLLLDDWVFEDVLTRGENVFSFLKTRYATWSSRLVVEGVLVYVTHSMWAFRVLDSLAMVLLAYSLCRLSACETRPGMLALAACLVTTIPFAVLRSTGWMATSLNYYWPLACAAGALIPLADALWRRRTPRLLQAAAVLLAIYGAGQEQTAAVIAGASLVMGAVLALRDRRIPVSVIAVFVLGAVQLVLHLTCPGNVIRSEQSLSIVNLRDYGQFSLIDKLSIGLTSTTTLLFFTWNPVLLATGALVLCTVMARRRGVVAVIMAFLPLGFMVFLEAVCQVDGLGFLSNYRGYVLQLGPERIGWAGQMEIMFIIVTMLGLMALSLYLSIGHRPLAGAAVFAFAIGFAARMALAFSPTVVESGERTMLPLYGAMMLAALLCLRDCEEEGAGRSLVLLAAAVCAVLAAVNVAGSFALAA